MNNAYALFKAAENLKTDNQDGSLYLNDSNLLVDDEDLKKEMQNNLISDRNVQEFFIYDNK